MSAPERRVTERQTQISDLSHLPRTGLKGSGAPELLRASGIPIPDRPNQWTAHLGGFVMRLGLTEFLLESAPADEWTASIDERARLVANAIPVLRQDTSLAISGPGAHDLLAQACSYPFDSFRHTPDEVVMTQMLGVSIIALRTSPSPTYRVWCDPSFGDYLLHTLEQIATEQAP